MPAPNYEGERIAGLITAELGMTGSPTIACTPERLSGVLRTLLDRGELLTGTVPTVSAALTPRDAMRLAAEQLAAGAVAARSPLTASAAQANALIAEGYRTLAATAAANVALQPDTEGNNR